MCEAGSHEHAEGKLWQKPLCVSQFMYRMGVLRNVCSCSPTLSVSGMPRVDIEGLLTLSDGSSQGKVSLHHPLLVVTVDNRFCGHGQRVTLGHVLGQGG